MVTSQGMCLEEEWILPESLLEEAPLLLLDLTPWSACSGTLTSSAVRESISGARRPQVCGSLLWQPQEMNTYPNIHSTLIGLPGCSIIWNGLLRNTEPHPDLPLEGGDGHQGIREKESQGEGKVQTAPSRCEPASATWGLTGGPPRTDIGQGVRT